MSAETARLIASLELQDKFSGPLGTAERRLTGLEKTTGRLSKGFQTAGNNLKLLGVGAGFAGIGLLATSLKSGIDSQIELQGVISATDAAIAAQGASAKVSADEIRAWSEQTEAAVNAAVDDKAIQAAANSLIRFGTIGHDEFQRTLQAATDLGAGMKTGPEAAAKLLGKALSDPVKGMTALRKAGIVLTKEEQERIKTLSKANRLNEAQAVLLKAIEARYMGAAAASAGPYQTALNKLHDAHEDLNMALAEGTLPLLTKVADKLSAGLKDPKTLNTIRDFGKGLAAGFDQALAIAEKIPWSSIGDSLKLAGQGAKTVLNVFTSMPPWVQTAVLTGWGLNKLTGGALGGIVSDLGKGLIKGVLGMNAGVVNIKAGVVNGGGVGAAGGGKGLLGKAGNVLGAVSIVGEALAVWKTWMDQNQASTDEANATAQIQLDWLKQGPNRADLENGLRGVKDGIAHIKNDWGGALVFVQGQSLDKLTAMEADLLAALAKLDAINLSVLATANQRVTVIPFLTQERLEAPRPGIGPRNTRAPVVRDPDDRGSRKGFTLSVALPPVKVSASDVVHGTDRKLRVGPRIQS